MMKGIVAMSSSFRIPRDVPSQPPNQRALSPSPIPFPSTYKCHIEGRARDTHAGGGGNGAAAGCCWIHVVIPDAEAC
jgi:hypothetical protein